MSCFKTKKGLIILVFIMIVSVYTAMAQYSVLPENSVNETGNTNINNVPVIESYTPEKDVNIRVNESQTFAITASDPDNDALSRQWYINDLPIADQTLESLNYTALEPGSFEIKILVTDNKDYTTHKWVLTVEPLAEQPENATEILLPGETEESTTEPINETQQEEPTPTEEIDKLIQLPAEINQKVRWVRTIINENQTTQLKIRIPETATNIKAKKIIRLITEEVKEEIPNEKIITEDLYSITGFVTAKQPRKAYILNFLKNIFRFIGFTTVEAAEKEVIIDAAAAKYEISYETPAPLTEETELENGKRVKVYAEMPYQNILTYTTVKETAGEIKLYWLINDARVLHKAELIDTDENNLTDKVKWIVERLSEQTFEIEITETEASVTYETIPEAEDVFDMYLPAKEIFYITNCPKARCEKVLACCSEDGMLRADYATRCPEGSCEKAVRTELEENPETFITVTNAKVTVKADDFGGQIILDIENMPSDFSQAKICAYARTTRRELLTNYVEILQDKNKQLPIQALEQEWASGMLNKVPGWNCIDVTDGIKKEKQDGKKEVTLRWWGEDNSKLDHIVFAEFTAMVPLDWCKNNNPSNANDCRPYLGIKL